MSLVAETADLARDAGRAFGRIADDARSQLRRAFEQSADDMRRAFQTGAGQTWNNMADDARRSFARGFDQSADDLRQAMQRGASQAANGAADDMRRDFNRAWDQSAQDMRDAFRRAANQTGDDMRDAMGRAGQSGGQQGGEAAASGLADALGGKAGVIGAALGTAVTAAGFSAGGLLAKALMSGLEREQQLGVAQARLGLDDGAMHKIGFAAGQAYTNAFGESVGDNVDTARRAIQAGILDPNATAQDTQAVIEQLTGISDLMGEEIPATARAVGQAIKTGIAGNATEAFDLFATAERNGLNVSEDFLDTITEYGTQFRKLGLDGPDALGLINQAVKAGARDVDTAADAIKEFSIRVVDGSDSTTEAFQALGFNADDIGARFAAGGESARTAMDEVLDRIRGIEDPLKRGQVAVGLFGTKWEDLGAAFDSFDLNTAASSLGNVAGATESALNAMGGNAATSIESAKRSIQVSLDEIGGSLAQTLGPGLAKVADWVADHQPEIVGFFATVADHVFVAADAFLWFSSESLRALGMFAEAAIPLIGQTIDPLGKVAELIGRVSGNDDLANFGQSMQNLDDKFQGVADGAYSMADAIDNTARPGLDRMRDSVAAGAAETQHAMEVTRALGDTVTALPSEHGIIISENSPEVTQRLEALGFKVTTLPDGRVEVTANTAAAEQMMRDFIAKNGGQQLKVDVLAVYRGVTTGGSVALPGNRFGGVIQGLAGGGVAGRTADGLLWGPGTGTSDSLLGVDRRGVPIVRVSPGEGVVREDVMSRGGDDMVAALNAGWIPSADFLRTLTGLAGGGVAGQRAVTWAQSKDGLPYIYGPQDCSWYMSGIYNQLTGKSVRFTTASDLASFGFKRGSDPNGFTLGTNGGVGEGGHMLGRLLGTNVESDGTNGVQYGPPADGPESMPQQWFLPRDLWVPPATDDTSLGSGGGATAPGGTGGASAPGGGGTAGGTGAGAGATGGGTYGGQEVPAGVTPVWIVGGQGTSTLEPTAPTTATDTGAAAPSSSASSTDPKPAEMPDVNARLQSMGTDFFNSNLDQFLGDLGLRRSGGAIQALVGAIYDAMADAAAAEVKKANNQRATAISQFGGR